jgi:bifunctional non-homologous end joining protein LigD
VAFQRRKPAAIGVKAPLPGFIEPALATSIEKVPSGERWIHEIKFDGYRVQVHLADESVKIFTRRGNDWSKRFKKVAHDAWRIRAASQSSMARSWCLPPTAPPISRCCRTS